MKKLALFILLFSCVGASADSLNQKEKTLALSNAIVEKFIGSDFDAGINLLRPHWPLPMGELDKLLAQIKEQWPIVDQRFGKAVGGELVRKEAIGDSFIRYYHLHKFQNHSIYWRISFYKPENTWIVNGITFLDSLDLLYEVVD